MLEFAAATFVTLVVIIDPVGTLPIFLTLTQHQGTEQRRRTAITSILIAAVTLIAVALAGNTVLRLLEISLPALRIAGGILLLLLSIDMVFARQSGIRSTTETETEEAASRSDVAVFPLAIPLIAGPGAITSLILLMGRTGNDLLLQAIAIALLLFVLGLTLATLLFAAPVMSRLGVTGINVIGRVFGIILAALAVQYIIDGMNEALKLPGGGLHGENGRAMAWLAGAIVG
jgi:multiple antibiotic resistance protein